jgi:ABC-type Fe3+-citrate transport system substrate-binding protein
MHSRIDIVMMNVQNLLIAMMGDTYSNMSVEAEKIWKLEKSRIIFSIEQEMSSEERESEENRYWVTLNGKKYVQVEEEDKSHFSNFE